MKALSIISIAFALFFSFACKKKKDTTEPDAQTPQIVVPEISVKVDGTTFSCTTCSSTYLSGGLRGVTFATSSTSDQIQFRFSTMPSVGTYTLVKQGNPAMTYVKNFTYYHAVIGNLIITSVDTSANGSINKLIATFQSKTDTTFTPSFRLTEGSIHLDYK